MIVERERLVLLHSAWTAATVAEAEREAHRDIEAAKTLGEITRGWSPAFADNGDADRWWEACFGVTERELADLAAAAARRYRLTPWWQRRQRREALASYIRADARLTVGHGLTTMWR